MFITDASGQRHEIPETVTVARNQDRYLQCTSCKANAWVLLFATDASITQIDPDGERTTKPVFWGACARHIRINLKRAVDAHGRHLVRRFDVDARRWVDVTA